MADIFWPPPTRRVTFNYTDLLKKGVKRCYSDTDSIDANVLNLTVSLTEKSTKQMLILTIFDSIKGYIFM